MVGYPTPLGRPARPSTPDSVGNPLVYEDALDESRSLEQLFDAYGPDSDGDVAVTCTEEEEGEGNARGTAGSSPAELMALVELVRESLPEP